MAVRKLEVEILADSARFSKGMREAETATGRFRKAAFVAGTAITGTLLVGLRDSVKASMAAEATTARLTAAFAAAHQNISQYAGGIDDAEKSGRNLGFTNTEVRSSLGGLVTATQDGTKAISLLGEAEDLARFKRMGLDSATRMLTAAMAGNVRAAKQLGISIPKDLTDPAEKASFVLKAVEERVHGQARAFSDTAAGGMAQFHAQTEALQESLGKGLLPILAKVAGGLATVAGWFERHQVLAKTLAVLVGGLGGALLAFSAAAKIAAATQAALNLVMSLNPIGAVILALTGLAVGLTIAWKKSETFRDIVKGTWAAVVAAAQTLTRFVSVTVPAAFATALNWVRSNWPVIATLISGPFAPLVALATNAFGVRSALTGAFSALKQNASAVIGDIVGYFRGMPGRIGVAITSGADAIKNAVTSLFGKVIGWVKSVLGIGSPSKVFHEIGQNVITGFINGVGSMAGMLGSAVKKMVTGLLPSFTSPTGTGDPGSGGQMDKTSHLVGRVLNALQYARQHGWSGQVTSGYRSYAEQAALYARYVRSGFDPRYLAAKPGTSSHERGEAVDVTDYGRFASIMAGAPASARLFNRLGGADPVHFSVSGYATGGWAGLHGPELAVLGEREPELVTPRSKLGSGALIQVDKLIVDDPARAELVASRVVRRLAFA